MRYDLFEFESQVPIPDSIARLDGERLKKIYIAEIRKTNPLAKEDDVWYEIESVNLDSEINLSDYKSINSTKHYKTTISIHGNGNMPTLFGIRLKETLGYYDRSGKSFFCYIYKAWCTDFHIGIPNFLIYDALKKDENILYKYQFRVFLFVLFMIFAFFTIILFIFIILSFVEGGVQNLAFEQLNPSKEEMEILNEEFFKFALNYN